MNKIIEEEMEILWSSFDENDVDPKLAAFYRLKASCSEKDIPRLVELLKSEKNDFWVRELLSEPICDLGGSQYLPELFEALALNAQEGHDNDGFHHFLTEVAESEPQKCKNKLNELLSEPEYIHRDKAEWLLSFC